ncbi:glycosyltransferase family 39 protein [Rhodococcus sp. R1101]|uniref:glycosyltransferase family 39 protein n=1 Tax=Rhodococcus sp. R1101 TaxID=1170698 RepID=UPI00030C803E|nr:glycosyltransferase family 39 protein [Rhodococcus sp. R1101]
MRAWSLPLLIGVATVLVAGAFSWVPSLWWDEAATISSADRSVEGMLRVHTRIDAVHGLHNLLLHYWFSLVGVDEFTARLPGVLALGVGAAAVTATGQVLAGRRVGIAAGVLFALSPRVTWAATEARSYAFAAALVAVLSLLVALGCTTGRRRWWALYALVLPITTVMFVYCATVVVAHAVTVAARGRERGAFLLSAGVGGALSVPFVLLAYSQAEQVAWIPPLDSTIVRTIVLDQWFPQAPWTAALFAALTVAAVVAARRRGVDAGERTLLWLAVPGFAVPMVLLLGYSLLGDNMYLERYLSFTVPAMVLLVGWAAATLATRWWSTLAVLTAVAVSVAPAYVQQRQPFGKPGGMDYSAIADRLIARSEPGDCVAFEPRVSWAPTSLRAVVDARPDAVEGLDDVGLGDDAVDRVNLWSTDAPPSELARRAAARCEVLWVIADGERETGFRVWHPNNVWWRFDPHRFTETDTYRELGAVGFRITDREPINRSQLIRLEPVQTQ